jgi:hypothetical protein
MIDVSLYQATMTMDSKIRRHSHANLIAHIVLLQQHALLAILEAFTSIILAYG